MNTCGNYGSNGTRIGYSDPQYNDEDKCCNVNVNETITDLRYDSNTGELVYRNEGYHLQGDGETRLSVKDMADDINLEDLGNVSDTVKKGCGILVHRSSCPDCGECEGCPKEANCEHEWYNWQAKDNEVTSGVKYLAGFTEDGCLVAIPAPNTGISFIIGRNGKWNIENKQLPAGIDPNTVYPAIGNKNVYGVNNDLKTPDKSTFIATHPLETDITGDIAFTSRTPGA